MTQVRFFFRLFLWFSLRHIKQHGGRAFTVLLGIALGAAVFSSVRLSVSASLDSFTRSMNLIAGRADRILTQPGGYVPEELMPALLRHPKIRHASPMLTAYVQAGDETVAPFLLVGLDPILDRPFRSWSVAPTGENAREAAAWLDLLKTPYSAVAGSGLARELGMVVGDRYRFDHAFQNREFEIVGIMNPQGMSLVEGGRVAITDIATFQEFTGLLHKVDRIDLKLEPGTSSQDLDSLQHLLPPGVTMNSPDAGKESGRMMIRSYQLNLSVLSFASLFVGMFLVYSLVALNAASRRREVAILRSVGALPGHVFLLFIGEGAFFGLFGWLLAIPVSSILIKFLIEGVNRTITTLFVRVQTERLSLDPWEILLSFAVTMAVSLLAAYQPAREAMGVSAKEALEMSQVDPQPSMSAGHVALVGLGGILLVLPLSRIPAVANIPVAGYGAILLLFAGFSLLVPWSLKQTGRIFSPALLKRFGISAYLAGRYVRDSGTRTAVSVGALITAVALFVSLVIMIYSFRQTVSAWAGQTIQGDLFVTTKMGEINRFRYPLPGWIVEGLESYRSTVDLVPNRRYNLTAGNLPYEFELLDMEGFLRHGSFFWLEGNPETMNARLMRGEGVVVSEVFSNRTGLGVGGVFSAQVEGVPVRLPILGVVRDYRTSGGVVFYSLVDFQKAFHPVQWSGLRMFIRDRGRAGEDAVADLYKELVRRFADHTDIVVGQRLRASILKVFDETFAVTSVLLLIALLIAALGIATTLAVLVLERSRQLNTLLAIGADYGQIRSMIFWEAAFLVSLGEIIGVGCGFVLSHLLIFVINRQSFGWTFLYGVDWGALLLSIPLIVLTALGAALPAVKMAFMESPASLLRER